MKFLREEQVLMMSRRISPMTDFAYLFEQMDRMAQDAIGGSPRARVATLPVDIYDRGEDLVVQAFVPGIHADSLEITIDDGVLTIAGTFPQLHDTEEAASWSWYTRELRSGSFQRSFNLPFKVDVEHVTAKVEDGVLWLTMPKAPESKPRRIQVGSGSTTVHEVEANTTS
ncbi:MAG: Hsp20/alpha crystallin family protein [Thermomicrobiales bacterium]